MDASGQTHEKVYDAAGKPNSNALVDLKACKPQGGGGQEDLRAVWTDPAFSPDQHAFYYARVLENPSCRWNQFHCNAKAVDCKKPMGTCSSGKGCNVDADCRQGEQCDPPANRLLGRRGWCLITGTIRAMLRSLGLATEAADRGPPSAYRG